MIDINGYTIIINSVEFISPIDYFSGKYGFTVYFRSGKSRTFAFPTEIEADESLKGLKIELYSRN